MKIYKLIDFKMLLEFAGFSLYCISTGTENSGHENLNVNLFLTDTCFDHLQYILIFTFI